MKFEKSVIDMGTIVLPVQMYEMKDVIVQSNIPMMVKYGDTIQFNAAAFKINEEWSALDLISRFPGGVIFDNKIMINGKPLLKVLLDGKEYKGDGVIKTLMNIPASVINNIQSYDKESDQARLTGFKDGREEGAFNIRTKNPLGVKAWVNASGEDGLNTNGKINNIYGVRGNGTVDNPTHRLLADFVITNSNGFGNNELSDVGGGMPLSASKPIMRTISDNKNLSLNYDYTKERFKFDVGCFILDLHDSRISDNYQSFFPVAKTFDSKIVTSNSRNGMDLSKYSINFGIEWTISKKITISLDNTLETSLRENSNSRRESILQDGDSVSRLEMVKMRDDEDEMMRGNAAFYYRISPGKRALSFQLNYYISSSDGNNTPQRYMNEVYDKDLKSWKSADANYNIKELSGSGKNNYTASLTYNEALGKDHQMTVRADYSSDNDSKTNSAYLYSDILDDYSIFSRTRSIYSDVETRSADVSLGYRYTGSQKLPISAAVGFAGNEQTIEDRLNPQYNVKADVLIPRGGVTISRKFTPITTVEFGYGLSGMMPTAQDLVPIIDDRNPSNISIGNPDLKSNRSHRFSLDYRRIEKNSFTATLSFEMVDNAIVRLMEFMPSDRDTVIYAVNAPADTVGKGYIPQRGAILVRPENRSGGALFLFRMNYGVYIKPLSSTFSTSLNYRFTKTNAYDGKDDFIRNNNIGLNLLLSSTISKNIDFSVAYDVNYSVRSMHGSDSFTTLLNGAAARVSYSFLKRMRFSAIGTWYHEARSDSRVPTGNYVNVNLDLGVYLNYRRNFMLSLRCDNLLDDGDGITRYNTDTYFGWSGNYGFMRYVSLKLS